MKCHSGVHGPVTAIAWPVTAIAREASPPDRLRHALPVPGCNRAPAGWRRISVSVNGLLSSQKRIAAPLGTDGGTRAMAAKELHLVEQRQHLACDRGDQRGVVAEWKVGATDRTLEQYVAEQGEAGGVVDEDDVARRVPRAVQYVEAVGAQGDRVALVQPAVRRDVAGGEAEAGGLGFDALKQEQVALVGDLDRYGSRVAGALAQGRRQFGRAAGVVQMTMGKQDALDGDARLVDGSEDAVDLTARIDHQSELGCIIPQDGAVLLEWRYWHDSAPNLTHIP